MLHESINKRQSINKESGMLHLNLLNIIEYLFFERLFGQVLLIEKCAAGKV